MRRIGFSMVLALVGVCAPLLLLQPIAAAEVLGPSQPQPTSAPECDPARVDPVVALEFQPRIARAGQAVSARVEFRNYSAYAVELLLSQPGYRTRFYDWSGAAPADGVLAAEAPAAVLHVAAHSTEVLTEAFRRGVLKLFVERDLLAPEMAEGMLDWTHSGFSVHDRVWLDEDDAAAHDRLARYCARCPVSLGPRRGG